jgi:4-hydroxy-tetrahydrodipicolinate synthase
MFHHSWTALITPFHNDHIDYKSFHNLLLRQGPSAGVVVAGTTGESTTLSGAEYEDLVNYTVQHSPVPVVAGTGCYATHKTIERTRQATQLGIKGAMVVVPYYNRPCQRGLYAHFKAIHNATTVPIMIYDIPKRTGSELEIETIVALSKLPRIVAIKEATGDTHRLPALLSQLPQDFGVLIGDDALVPEAMNKGAHGVVSVLGNLEPTFMQTLCTLCHQERMVQAKAATAAPTHPLLQEMIHQLDHYLARLDCGVNPVAIKHCLAQDGHIQTADVRLPLVGLV